MRRLLVALGALLLLGGITVAIGWSIYRSAVTTPLNPQDEEPRVFLLDPGTGPSQVAQQLEEQNLIASARWFKLLVRLTGAGPRIKAGEYELSASMTPEQILERIQQGGVILYSVTIPEGYRISEIAGVLEAAGLCDAEALTRRALDPQAARDFGLQGAPHLEGYLYPDTYRFAKGLPVDKLLEGMIARFRKAWTPEYARRAGEIGFTMNQAVTLASIIEKETGAAHERPIISSVFHNRLKDDWLLNTDPTVIYGIKNFNGNLTRQDLKTDHEYNTYTRKGLTPGPIASPGDAALKAALWPTETGYYFFVSRNDGTHVFNETIEGHNRDVEKWQRQYFKKKK